MRYELKLHRITLGIIAIVLILFVAFLLRIRPSLVDERLEATVSLAISVVVASAFGTIGIIESAMAFLFGKRHRRELWSYLFLGVFSLACGLFLAASEIASLQRIALVVSPHALAFGLGELRLAQRLERHPTYRRAFLLGGMIELLFGFVLLGGARLSSEQAATLLGYVAVLTILQILPLLFYRYKSIPQPTESY
jgi:uncharacterized membrane protein HdeD (DUF308 family)